MTCTRRLASSFRLILRLATLLVLFALPILAAQAQDDDRAGAPRNLSSEATEDGLVLSWDAPDLDGDPIIGYEIEAQHVRRGVGIVEELNGITDAETRTWTDLTATDPDLLYVYRVRALIGEDTGRWSAFLITDLESDADDEAEAEPTAVPPAAEPTAVPPEAEVEPTVAGQVEPTAVAEAPRQLAPTTAPPVVEVEPTAVPPDPEPTAVPPAAEPEPTRAGQVEPTAVAEAPRQMAPTTAPPVVEVEPTAVPPEPEATAQVALPEVQPTVAGAEAEPTPSA